MAKPRRSSVKTSVRLRSSASATRVASARSIDRSRYLSIIERTRGQLARFQIEGAPPEEVLALLTPPVRAALTALAEQGELTMDAERVALRAPRLVAGDAIGVLVGAFATLAAELDLSSCGPFR